MTIFKVLGLAIYIKKYLKAKSKTMEAQNISPCKKVIFKKKSSKRNQNLSKILQLYITNLKIQHKPKYHLSKILI
jgi:hypothetical protein